MNKLTENYRVFLLSIESVYGPQSIQFLYQLKQNLKKKVKVKKKDKNNGNYKVALFNNPLFCISIDFI